MPYRHYTAGLTPGLEKTNTLKDGYTELAQELLNTSYYNASNWWTIKEETTIGSGIFSDVDVRISHLINEETGLKLGDDWKSILFKENEHEIELGRYYQYDDNTWLTINTQIIKSLYASCAIRRCNNTLRWIDEATGAYYEEPCCIEYLVKEPRDYATQGSPFLTPGGFLHIDTQFNSKTTKIKPNQRFLFGNTGHWACFRVVGTGVNNFRNMKTYDNDSAKILTLDLVANFVNDELDDIVNGIADVNTNVYTIDLNLSSAQGAPGDTITLVASVTYNGDTVTRDITWATSDSRIATVSTSGVVTFIKEGSCYISGAIKDNPLYATCYVTVTSTPTVNIEIRVSPDKNYVLEGDNKTYTVYMYENGVQQADTFTITCNPNGIASDAYTFEQLTGNQFKLTNIQKSVDSYLTIVMQSGIYTKSYNIYLRGGW